MRDFKPNINIFQNIILFLIVIFSVIYVRNTWITIENDKLNRVPQIVRSVEVPLPKADLKAPETFDINTSNTVAVFGMDFDSKSWNNFFEFKAVVSGVLIILLLLVLVSLLDIKAKNKLLKDEIIKLKLMDEVLSGSEEKYRYLFAHNPQPMFIYDLETLGFLEVNRLQ